MSGSRDAIEHRRGRTAFDIQAEKKQDDGENAEKTAADSAVAIETGRREQNGPDQNRHNEGGEKPNRDKTECVGDGGVDGCIETATDFPEIVHVSRSLMQASLLVLLLGASVAFCGPVAVSFAGVAFLSWAVFLTVFYVVFRCWGNHLGVPTDMTQTILALLVTALALLVSGNAVTGLLIAGIALGLCGAVAGTWLAVLAARTGKTLRQSLAAVFDLKGHLPRSFAR